MSLTGRKAEDPELNFRARALKDKSFALTCDVNIITDTASLESFNTERMSQEAAVCSSA